MVDAGRGIVLFPLLTGSLRLGEYGVWALVSVTVTLLYAVSGLGLGGALVSRFAPQERSNAILTALVAVSAWSCAVGLALAAGADLLADMLNTPGVARPLRLGALLLPLGALTTLQVEALKLLEVFGRYALLSVGRTVGEIIGIAVALRIEPSVTAVVAGMVVADVLALVLGWWLLRSSRPAGGAPTKALLRPLLAVGLPLVPTMLGYLVINFSDRYFIGRLDGPDAVGRYTAAYALGALLVGVGAPILAILVPAATRRWHAGDRDGAAACFSLAVKAYLLLGVPATVGLGLLGRDLLLRLAPAEYADAAPLIPLIAAGYVVFTATAVSQYVFQLAGTTRVLLATVAAGAGLNLVLNMALVPPWGAEGAAAATLVSFVATGVPMVVLSRRHLKFGIGVGDVWRCAVAALSMAAVVHAAGGSPTFPSLLLRALVGAAVYAGAAMALRVVSQDERRILADQLRLRHRAA